MSHSRHHAREVALQVLYRFDLESQGKGSSLEASALSGDLARHFEHFQVTPAVREFAAELVAGTLMKAAEIDAEIEKVASNWKVARMAVIDRNLLRMAYFEMTHFKDIPHTVTIDEAVELAKQFGTSDTPGFVNGVLDQIRKTRL